MVNVGSVAKFMKSGIVRFSYLVVLFLALISCNVAPVEVVTPVSTTPPGAESPTVSTARVNDDVAVTTNIVITSVFSNTALAGLIYWDDEGWWQIDASGQPTSTINWGESSLSSDGRYEFLPAFFTTEFRVYDHHTNQAINIVADSDRNNFNPQWWPAKPDQIIFGSWGPDPAGWGPGGGFLSAINIDGSNYRILDESGDINEGRVALDPAGEQIAYSRNGIPWLYLWSSAESVPFSLDEYRGEVASIRGFFNPGWSPDGSKMVWTVAFDGEKDNQSGQFGLMIIHHQQEKYYLTPLFEVAPYWTGSSAGNWSPDGRWLSFVPHTEDTEKFGLWIMTAEAEPVFFLPEGRYALWSPDGRGLIIMTDGPLFGGPENGSSFHLVAAETWETTEVALPSSANLVSWESIKE